MVALRPARAPAGTQRPARPAVRNRAPIPGPARPAQRRRRRPGGWKMPCAGRAAHVTAAPEYQATTAQVCGLFPFVAGRRDARGRDTGRPAPAAG